MRKNLSLTQCRTPNAKSTFLPINYREIKEFNYRICPSKMVIKEVHLIMLMKYSGLPLKPIGTPVNECSPEISEVCFDQSDKDCHSSHLQLAPDMFGQ